MKARSRRALAIHRRLLEVYGERVHPSSARLASESRHIELESGVHELNAFQAIRRMDDVLTANFMNAGVQVWNRSM